MIISISGRKRTGKSTIANYLCNERGFIKAAFSDFLKNLVCYAFDVDRVFLETVKDTKGFSLSLNNVIYRIKEYCGIPNDYDFEIPQKVVFSSYREALQYIGSELIRKYDHNFYVKIMEKFLHENKDKNICIDDTRFPNELQMLKKTKALCYFVIKPNCFDVSNHHSETSLTWNNFDDEYIIINDTTEKKFIKKIKDHLDTKNKETKYSRKYFLELLEKCDYDSKMAAKDINCSTDKIIWWCNKFNIRLTREKYTSDNSAFLKANEISAYYAGLISASGCIKKSGKTYVIEFTNTDKCLVEGLRDYCKTNAPIFEKEPKKPAGKKRYSIVLNNPYIVENIKRWDLEPRKGKAFVATRRRGILTYGHSSSSSIGTPATPSILRNTSYIKNWIVGLIDGDGSVYNYKTNHKKAIPSS